MAPSERQLWVVEGEQEQKEEAGEGWKRALATGDRSVLLPEVVRTLLTEAGREDRLHVEIGALRIVVERLLAEVRDTERLAALLPRVTNAIIRAMQVQRALGGDTDEELAELVRRALALPDDV